MENEIIGVIARQFNLKPADISTDHNFTDDLRLDSLDLVELIMSIEKQFNLRITEEEGDQINKVSDLIHFVKKSAKP